jgi:hypothetical protein
MNHIDMHPTLRKVVLSLRTDYCDRVQNSLRNSLHSRFMRARLNVQIVGVHAIPQWRGNPNRIDWPWRAACNA